VVVFPTPPLMFETTTFTRRHGKRALDQVGVRARPKGVQTVAMTPPSLSLALKQSWLRERPLARSSTASPVWAPFSFGEGSVNDVYAEALAGR